jgi:gliding motility-associated-like protein
MGLEGSSAISSPTGTLLFYTNADMIWDREGRVMPNGSGIGGYCTNYGSSSSSQSALIVPHPGNANLYYVFTSDCAEDDFVNGVRYSVVDISLRNGLGDVTIKNQLLVSHAAEKIAAIFHPNGHDLWVVTHEVGTNRFLAYSVTDAGLNTTPRVSATGQVHVGGRGYLKFSPDGKRLAAGSFVSWVDDGIETELFRFDGNTGIVQSDFILTGDISYSLSFSPNSKLLYTSCAWACFSVNVSIIQYNLEAGTPQQVIAQRYSVPDSRLDGALQLGPDGQLYYIATIQDDPSNPYSYYMAVFADPNKIGAASSHNHRYLPLPCWIQGSWGLPNFIESYFQTAVPGTPGCGPVSSALVESVDYIADTDCTSQNVVFENTSYVKDYTLPDVGVPSRWTWDFDDGSPPLIMYEPPVRVEHLYAQPGTYHPSLTYWQIACDVDVAKKEIAVGGSQAVIDIHQDCQSLEVSFSAHLLPTSADATWHWDFGDENTSTAQNPVHLYSEPGDYTVTLSAKSQFCEGLTRTLPTHVHGSLDLGTSFVELCQGETLQLQVPIDIPGNVQWNFGSEDRAVSLSDAGEYWVRIIQDDCIAADTVTLAVRDCAVCPYAAPNVITPNDDDKNDTFVFQTECAFLSYRMNLYDRWGHRIYTTTSPVWDGRIHNEVPATGVYYYTVEFTHMGAHQKMLTKHVKGWLQVLH